jgi:pyruvate-ferredoxin/flavodoxin oxidoreductase
MTKRRGIAMDGNEAVASVAYRCNEVIAIYPITPASPMGELADAWVGQGRANLWGDVPQVVEMQSEGGAAGTVHGALQGGSLTTTFTASQGLLLMLPNLYKIAGELTPCALHVAARTIATHALSIFGDHSDVMAARPTGFALLASSSPQEAHDFALVAQAATLRSRVPFLHFFDGFRTSHEIAPVEMLSDDDLAALLDGDAIEAHRHRALTPDHPVLRGTAQNPDAFFQAREAANRFYQATPGIVQETFDQLAARTGRQYHRFDYHGHPEAERVMVLMGSGTEAAHETVDHLVAAGEKVGIIKVRLYRPFDTAAFLAALPATARIVAVLDRTKEPGSPGEPLYLDVVAALANRARSPEPRQCQVVGGRYGLSSKEFNPAAVKAVFDHLRQDAPRHDFTVGIVDDITHTSLPLDADFDIEPDETVRAMFFGLGSDGTVGANKGSIKLIAEATDLYTQGYFVYDSKKAGAVTISHLRFGPRPIRSTYLIRRANFVACHQFNLLDRLDVLECATPGATLLLNSPHPATTVWSHLNREVQDGILEKGLRLYVLDAYQVAKEAGLGGRINTIMQVAFFHLTGVLPMEAAIEGIKATIEKSYGKRGREVVRRNFAAVDRALEHLEAVPVPDVADSQNHRPPLVAAEAPDFVQRVTAVLLAGKGDALPVSAFPVDGTWPTATSQWEKRRIAREVPLWDPEVCIQCNQCALACPHAAIRAKVYPPEALDGKPGAPENFLSTPYRAPDFKGSSYTLQVAPEDCTGCHLCVEVCPARNKSNPRQKAIHMEPLAPVLEQERQRYRFFLELPEVDSTQIKRLDAKGSQFLRPLFEYSGACAGCGETPYLKLLSQLFGDRLLIANATGCSSIFGGNLPTTPWAVNAEGRGPAWANSLFEDNAEFGLGLRLAVDHLSGQARRLLEELADPVGEELARAILEPAAADGADIGAQRSRVALLRERLEGLTHLQAPRLMGLAEYLVPKSVWLVGGDGWAYDIGYGGLDHVLALGRNVNVLVLDTEVYSNTGGQQSKATPLGAAAKFAATGKELAKKDLGLEMMSYGHIYVARVAFGGKMNQTVEALREAEAFPGPSLVIAYSHCIAHGYDMAHGPEQQKRAVESGIWPLYRYDPRRAAAGKPPLKLDSAAPKGRVAEYMQAEARFRMVEKQDPQRYRRFLRQAQEQADQRRAVYQQLAGLTIPQPDSAVEEGTDAN